MDALKTVDFSVVLRTWVEVKKNMNTFAPEMYMAILRTYPEYHQIFPSLANIPFDELPTSDALRTFSIKVLTKMSDLIDLVGNPDSLVAELKSLGADHKKMGATAADFDKIGAAIVDHLAATFEFTSADREAWTTTMTGLNSIIATAL